MVTKCTCVLLLFADRSKDRPGMKTTDQQKRPKAWTIDLRMSNPEATKAEYLKVLLDLKKDPNNEIIHTLQVAEEENSV